MVNIITDVLKNSISEEVGIEIGDVLLEINGKQVLDIFDYRFLISDTYIEVVIEKQNGEEWRLEIEKYEDEDLGLSFAMPMMDKTASCRNKCIFCFIDQLPKGMRHTLYFKDDDSRLSFLQGNYVTLTNISDKDFNRIIYYHFSPINVSVHTTNNVQRIEMLGNKNAGKIMEQLNRMSQAGIELNCQIVLVKGVNDGVVLSRTIDDLIGINGVKSVSVVPVGLTKYRNGLTDITPFNKQDANDAITLVEQKQGRALLQKGSRLVYGSDEFYLKAEKSLPPYEHYDDFPQLENGVGIMRMFENEFNERYKTLSTDYKQRNVTVVTGKSAFCFMKDFARKLTEKLTNTQINVVMVTNEFFGENITVSGLLTGQDIIRELKGNNVKGKVLLPSNCFRANENILLDNISLDDISNALNAEVIKTPCNGSDFISALI